MRIRCASGSGSRQPAPSMGGACIQCWRSSPYGERPFLRIPPPPQDLYSPYIGDASQFEAYCIKMANGGEWGDHVTLQAIANAFSVDINLVTSYHFNGVIEVTARSAERASRACWLSFWAEVHYNSIYPVRPTLPRRLAQALLAAGLHGWER